MHDRRIGAWGIRPGWVLLVGIAVFVAAERARGGGHRATVVPSNAVQPPGPAGYGGYPKVGPRQRVKLLEEVVGSSVGEVAHAPSQVGAQFVRRLSERVTVGAQHLVVKGKVPRHIPPVGSVAPPPGLEPADRAGVGGPPVPARITLLADSDSAVGGLLNLIASARCQIDLMMYGWEDDPTGREVAAALAARAQAGVRVRLLVDRGGFLIHNPAAAQGGFTFLDALRGVPNVTVIEPDDPCFRFDHRKLAIVDGRVAWSGSMILTEVARRRWRNLSFLAEGPVVAHYALTFERRWEEVGGPPASVYAPPPPPAPNAVVRLVRTDVDGDRSLVEAIYHAVDHARDHIYLENPYFSDRILIEKLCAARARGVDVRAVLTLRGNVRFFNQFETLTANRLLSGGARVYLYPAMTHVKAMSVDGTWAYLGTGNFDELSLRNNREVGLSVTGPELVSALEQIVFLTDMVDSQELFAPLPPPRHRLLLMVLSLWL